MFQRVLAGQADRADAEPAQQGEAGAVLGADEPGHDLDHEAAREERGAEARVHRSAGVATEVEEPGGLDREVHDHQADGPPAPVHDAERHEAQPRREAHEDRAEQQVELRHAEGELTLRREQALHGEPPAHDVHAAGPPAVGRSHPGAGQDEPGGEAREGGAQDHQHVGRAPHGHVDPVGLVPDLVEGEAGHGTETERPERQQRRRDAQRAEPVAVHPVEGRHQRAEHGATEDHHQAEQDAAVRRGHELVVTAEGDVPGHVGVEALPRDEQAVQRHADRHPRPTGDAGDAGDAARDARERPQQRPGRSFGRPSAPRTRTLTRKTADEAPEGGPRGEGRAAEGSGRLGLGEDGEHGYHG